MLRKIAKEDFEEIVSDHIDNEIKKVFTELLSGDESLLLKLEQDINLSQAFYTAISKGVTIGLEMVENKNNILSKLNEQQNLTVENFEENKGVSGILLPNGQFLSCGNGEHHIAVKDITLYEQIHSVYFSSVYNYKDGVVTFSPLNNKQDLNEQQKIWLNKNLKYLDKQQRNMLANSKFNI